MSSVCKALIMKEDKPPSLADLNPSESPVVSGIGVEVISVFAGIIGFVIRFVIIWLSLIHI